MAIQRVEVRFEGEKLTMSTSSVSVNTLHRTPEGLYRVYVDEGETAFLESGHIGNRITEEQVRKFYPELVEAAGL
jgi:hypothetical protein